MAIRTYDPTKITIVCGGHLVTGLGQDTFINVEFDEDDYGKSIGVGGEGARFRIANKSASVSITLQHTSPTNDFFMSMWLADSQSGTGALPFVMRDEYGTSIYTSAAVWVKKRPAFTRGRSVNDVVWMLDSVSMEGYVGSNR